jgi:hypothetical protein
VAFSLEKRYEEKNDERGVNFFVTRLDFHREMKRTALERISPLGGAEFLLAGELAVYQLSLESLKAGFAADPFFGNAQLNGHRGAVGPRVKALRLCRL